MVASTSAERRKANLGRMAVEAALAVIDRHFAAENAHDVEATLATYTEDIVWDDVTHPGSPFRGKQAVAEAYFGILQAIPDLNLRSVMGRGGTVAAIDRRHIDLTFPVES